MTVNTTAVEFDINATDAQLVAPVSVTSKWSTLVPAGGMDAAANGGSAITNPIAQMEPLTETFPITSTKGRAGTNLVLVGSWSGTISGSPSVNVFGRHSPTSPWIRLADKSLRTTIPINITDAVSTVIGGTTVVVGLPSEPIDLLGCTEVLVGPVAAVTGTNPETMSILGVMI